MVSAVTELSGLAPNGYHSCKLLAYHRAYGSSYDFCRFYRSDTAYIMIFNSNAVIAGSVDEETAAFIAMSGAYTAETPQKADIEGYISFPVYHMTKKPQRKHPAAFEALSYERLREIVGASFPEADLSLWYCDISHRIRHGISRGFLLGSSFAAADTVYGGEAFLSSVATAPEYRRTGSMKRLLDSLPYERISVIAEADMVGFYLKCGFEAAAEYCIYKQEDRH